MRLASLLFVFSFFFLACSEEQPDVVQSVAKDGSVEVVFRTKDLSSSDVGLEIEYVVWNKGSMVKKQVIFDTLPNLGTMVAETEDEQTAIIPKQYDFFVTIQ